MASLLRRAMVYLGLVDDEYEIYDDEGYNEPPVAAPARAGRAMGPDEQQTGVIRTLPRDNVRDDQPSGVTITAQNRTPSVRPIVSVQAARVHVVVVKSFDDAREIGDRMKDGQPVIVNLQGIDKDVRRRLLDFASGLVYGLGASIKAVAGNDVVLLTPPNVEVSAEEKRRLQERGLYRAT